MSEELKTLIKQVGDEIKTQLLPKPGYPVRNPYAHIFGMVRELCEATYSEAPPEKVRAVVEAIRRAPNGGLMEIFESAKKICEENKKTGE